MGEIEEGIKYPRKEKHQRKAFPVEIEVDDYVEDEVVVGAENHRLMYENV